MNAANVNAANVANAVNAANAANTVNAANVANAANANTTNISAAKDAMHNEAMHNEAMHKEMMYKEAMYKEAMYKEAMHKEAMYKEAIYYEKTDDGAVHCRLCHHRCVCHDGQTGFCGVRSNRAGVLYADSYGLVSSVGLDPIEKKPLNRFFPGSLILSVGNYGCNFRCAFCQNHGISTVMLNPSADKDLDADMTRYTPEELVRLARHYVPKSNIGLAFTYNEPLIGYEFVMDCTEQAKAADLQTVLVSNGCIQPTPFAALLTHVDAINIDLKAFTENFYHRIQGDLNMVKANIANAAQRVHVEVTTLIIPGENDSDEEIDGLARFLADINPEIPLHLSRFVPRYKMTDKVATPWETVCRLATVAKRHLRYVYY